MLAPKTIHFISLGCAKNRVDTEVMLGVSGLSGFSPVDDPEAAEVIVVNTCGFIDAAKEESVDTILEMAELKRSGACKKPSDCLPGGRLNLLLSYAGWHQDPWVDRLPKLLEPMGVLSHRAESGREAQDVIRHTPIHIAVVDLGLPLDTVDSDADAPELSEGGSRLLELLHRLDQFRMAMTQAAAP